MIGRRALGAAWLIGILAAAPAARAWGPQGHRVIARVAADRLTPEARAAVKELLLEGDTLATIATWADEEGHDAVPGSAAWHYVNIPIAETAYNPRFAGPKGGGVVEKIKQFRRVLADREAPLRERRRALLFLVHFVGDVHQPLHVGDNRDHGGNDTQVQFYGRGTNLHRLWDSDLIHHVGGDDRAWVARVERLITPRSAQDWSAGTVESWATETLHAAQLAYRGPGRAGGAIGPDARLGEDYARMADPIVREQMARASVRLANELNVIFR